MKSVNIPQGNSVTEIGESAFENCTSLTSISLPNCATIYNRAFYGCSSLKSVNINARYIGNGAFQNCSNLIELIFNPSLLNNDQSLIIYNSFDTYNIKSVTLNSNVVKNYRDSFYNPIIVEQCDIYRNLESLTLGDYVDCCHFLFDGRTLKNIEFGKIREISNKFGDFMSHDYGDDFHDSETHYAQPKREIPLTSGPNLEVIKLREPTPPDCSVSATNNQYINVKLYVPKGSLKAYQNDENWGKFWEIIEYSDKSGVDDIPTTATEKRECGRYDLMGRPATDDYQGITIIKYNDGTTKKCISGR